MRTRAFIFAAILFLSAYAQQSYGATIPELEQRITGLELVVSRLKATNSELTTKVNELNYRVTYEIPRTENLVANYLMPTMGILQTDVYRHERKLDGLTTWIRNLLKRMR